MKWISRGLAVFSTGLAGIIATSLMAVMGGLYLWQCYLVLIQPGVPLEVTYVTASGERTFRAESFSVDPWKQRLELNRAALTEEDGGHLVRAERVAVEKKGEIYHANASGLALTLSRDARGQFNVLGFIPKSVPGQHGPGFILDASEVHVTYIDVSPQPLIRFATLKSVTIQQDKGDTFAVGSVRLSKLEYSPFEVQLGPNGEYFVDLAQLHGDATDLLPVARRFVDAKAQKSMDTVGASGIQLDGNIQVSSLGKSDVDVRGAVRLSASRLDYGEGKLAGVFEGSAAGSLQRADIAFSLLDGSRSLSFDGAVAVLNSPRALGKFRVRSGNQHWPLIARSTPKGLNFGNGDLQGWLALSDGKVGAQASGKLGSVGFQKERFDRVVARAAFDGTVLSLTVDSARWRGGSVKASFETDIKRKTLNGFAQLPSRPLGPLLADYGVSGLSGSGQAVAVISGGYQNPKADIFANGSALIRGPDKKYLAPEPFEARINVDGKNAKLSRLTLSGPNGILVASGVADLRTKGLKAEFVAGAFPLSVLHPEASGTLFAKGEAFGTFDKPRYSAHVEGYGVKFKEQGAALLVVDLTGDSRRIKVDSLRANSGTGLLSATGDVDLKTKAVTGSFSADNLSISDWLGSEFLGTVNITDGLVRGTYDDPQFTARIAGDKIYAYGSALDTVNLLVDTTTKVLSVINGTVTVGNGTIVGSGKFGLANQTGSLNASASQLPLDRLVRPGPELSLIGFASGNIKADLTSRGWTGKGDLALADINLNDTAIGAGSLNFGVENGFLTATGEIGSVDRYLSLESLAMNLDDQSVKAEIAAFNMRVKDLITATKPIWSLNLTEVPDVVNSVDGQFSGTASLESDKDSWAIGQSDITVEDLAVAGRKAGKLVAKVTRQGSAWAVPTLTWQSEGTTLTAKGTYDENGQIDVEANLNDLELGWINAIWPETPLIAGKATATIVAKGDKDDPSGRASLLIDQATVVSANSQTASDPIHLFIDNVTFGNKRADLSGQATFQGFTGNISAKVPYSSLQTELRRSRREPLSASIEFLERPLQDFKEQMPDVDMEKSDGTIRLSATLNGLVESLKVDANAQFDSKRFVHKNLDTELNNLGVVYKQTDRKAMLTAKGESAKGGLFDVNMAGNLADVFGSNFSVDELLDDSTVKGTVKFDQFAWSQKLPGALLPTLARIDGDFGIEGKFRTPTITGGVTLDQVLLNLPNEIIAGTAGGFSIDPILDNVRVAIAKGTKIETGVGALSVSGVGSLNGSLSDPNIRVPLRLDEGTFRLPSGRIALEPGGDLIFTYASIGGGEPVARVNLDLEGHTNVVSKRSTGQYETYQVTINIRGNALDEKSLQLSATSDPGDLSQEEILALIGQRDLIQGIAQTVFGGGDNGFFRDAFYSIAIPNVSQNLTQGIASGLNLDYLTVDYNPFDQFVLSAGKTIGKGLVLQASRQLQQTNSEALKWEVKLVYRLPVADRFFSRVRLAFGIDQSVPYKLSINWSHRF